MKWQTAKIKEKMSKAQAGLFAAVLSSEREMGVTMENKEAVELMVLSHNRGECLQLGELYTRHPCDRYEGHLCELSQTVR